MTQLLNLKLASILQKNKLSSDEPWLDIIEVHMAPDTDADTVFYLANNNEDVVYKGNTYIAFAFQLNVVEKSAQGQLPSVTLQVSNVNRLMQSQIEQYGGGVDATVILRTLHANDLSGEPELDIECMITGTSADEQWVTFTLGAPNPLLRLFPPDTYIADFCRHVYNTPTMQDALDPLGASCGYEGPLQSCSQTLEGDNGCRAHDNVGNFGGCPGINSTGIRNATPA